MNNSRIKELTESLQSIRSAKFMQPNWAFISLDTDFTSVTARKVIRTSPLNQHHSTMTDELNEAIRPVLEKYAKIFEDEIRKEVLK